MEDRATANDASDDGCVYPLHRVGIEPARIIHARSGSNIGRHGGNDRKSGTVLKLQKAKGVAMIGQILSSIVGLGTSYLDSKGTIAKAKAEKRIEDRIGRTVLGSGCNGSHKKFLERRTVDHCVCSHTYSQFYSAVGHTRVHGKRVRQS